jgi:hypothetical protein
MAATLVTAHGRTADRKTLDAASARRMRRGTGAYSDQKADIGWVRVQKLPDGLV